jgi:hypothetical protein
MIRPAQMMKQQRPQSFVAAYSRCLQELAQLMHLNARIHVLKQLPGLFDRFLGRRIDSGFQIAMRWDARHATPLPVRSVEMWMS